MFACEEEAMKTEKHDRRSERTRHTLGDALVSLMLERRYVDLTVQDILDRANIGRSTFYAHFWDKDDLLASTIARMIEALSQHMDQGSGDSTALLPSLGLFQHVQGQYHLLYRAFVPLQGVEMLTQTLRGHLCQHVEQRLRRLLPAPTADLTIMVTTQAVVGAFLALLHWWLEQEMPLSPEQMDAHFRQLVLPGVQALVRQGGNTPG
jgi:AcrR family transcriptional regulator